MHIWKIFIFKRRHMAKYKLYISSFLLALSQISQRAMLIFKLGASSVCFALAALIRMASEAAAIDPVGAFFHYSPMVEYIIMTFLIVFIGTLAFDTAERYYKKSGN